MNKIMKAGAVFLCSLSIVGCTNNQDAGTITGAIAGGLLGSTIGHGSGKAFAIVAGSIAGAVIGGSIGRNMDMNDRMRMNMALDRNPVGRPTYWTNDSSGSRYEVVPVRNVSYEGHQYCREYRTVAYIAGKKQEMFGTACRQPDGTWQAVS